MQRYRWALVAVLAFVAIVVVYALASGSSAGLKTGPSAIASEKDRQPAPELTGLAGWVNSPPLSIHGLRGKVVLVDFWTFSCVNCIRTIPHTQALVDRYGQDGLVVIGVHSPEFDFEKVPANVQAAVARDKVTWPVALDSDMRTWNAFSNRYWPAQYLIDRSGNIAYTHFGEGDDAATDHAVSTLVGVAHGTPAASTEIPGSQTPELYAGSARGTLADGAQYGPSGQPTSYPDASGAPRDRNAIFVSGEWIDGGEYLEAASAGHVRVRYRAHDVYVVAGTAGSPVSAAVHLDGRPVSADMSGAALESSGVASAGSVIVNRTDLFHMVTNSGTDEHVIDIAVPKGFRLYTFTFG